MTTMDEEEPRLAPLIRHQLRALGTSKEDYSLTRVLDSQDRRTLYLIEAGSRPSPGLRTYVTAGLSDTPMPGLQGWLRAELMTVSSEAHPWIREVMSDLEEGMRMKGWPLQPFSLLVDAIRKYDDSLNTKHVLLTSPLIWSEELDEFSLGDVTVTWLMLIPITDAERAYAQRTSPKALAEAILAEDADICNWDRESLLCSQARSKGSAATGESAKRRRWNPFPSGR